MVKWARIITHRLAKSCKLPSPSLRLHTVICSLSNSVVCTTKYVLTAGRLFRFSVLNTEAKMYLKSLPSLHHHWQELLCHLLKIQYWTWLVSLTSHWNVFLAILLSKFCLISLLDLLRWPVFVLQFHSIILGHCKMYRDTGSTGSHQTLILTLYLTTTLNPILT